MEHHSKSDKMVQRGDGEEGGCGDMGTLIHCWWECKMIQPQWRTAWQTFKVLTELSCDPVTPILDVNPKELKT